MAPMLLALLAGPPAPRQAPAAAPRPAPQPRPPQRPTGTVAGQLRHKGCRSSPAGATISAIGLDASTAADSAGRFALPLPPGSYSLVIDGPGLVSDQRVDDVAVAAGQTRDLGTVEVWPDERPANCGAAEPTRPSEEPVVAIAPDTPSLILPGDRVVAAQQPADPWVRASPGTGPGQLALQGNPSRPDEDALGPPSFAVGPTGSLWVLDALNRRVVRFDPRGHALSTFPMAHIGDAPAMEADLTVTEEGHVFLFTTGEMPVLAEYDSGGRLLVAGALPAPFRSVSQLSCTRARPWFLMQNGQAVRVELSWGGLRGEGPLPGLPLGDLFARAERTGRFRAAVKLATGDGRVRRSIQLHSRVPVTGVRLVGVDRRGDLVLAVDRAERSESGASQAEVLLLSLTPLGHLGAARAVPPGGRRFEFREFALAPDGSVVQMQSDAAEVRFVRWALLPPPRETAEGEGILRGRVLENGRPAPGATVTVGRPRRSVPLSADGSFEVRLPAGTYTLSVRTPVAGSAPEPLPVEVRVAVAPGATVDIGNVVVAPRVPRPEPLPAGR
jgi:hypothetical protein